MMQNYLWNVLNLDSNKVLIMSIKTTILFTIAMLILSALVRANISRSYNPDANLPEVNLPKLELPNIPKKEIPNCKDTQWRKCEQNI